MFYTNPRKRQKKKKKSRTSILVNPDRKKREGWVKSTWRVWCSRAGLASLESLPVSYAVCASAQLVTESGSCRLPQGTHHVALKGLCACFHLCWKVSYFTVSFSPYLRQNLYGLCANHTSRFWFLPSVKRTCHFQR